MTSIRVGKPLVTLINVFTVQPERQQPANLHRSLDGQRITNYA